MASAETVIFEGRDEVVLIHPEHGPIVNKMDGSIDYLEHFLGTIANPLSLNPSAPRHRKRWTACTITEKEILVNLAAKMNRRLQERMS